MSTLPVRVLRLVTLANASSHLMKRACQTNDREFLQSATEAIKLMHSRMIEKVES